MNNTAIEWTDLTWNPVRGCRRVSEGCRNCYAEAIAARFSGPGQPFEGYAERTPAGPRWTGKAGMAPDKTLTQPLRSRRWAEKFRETHGRRPRVFVNSMSDLFYEGFSAEQIDQVFAVMALAHWYTFIVLTKRAKRMREHLSRPAGRLGVAVIEIHKSYFGEEPNPQPMQHLDPGAKWFPLPNVWMGVSVEDQATANQRVPELLATPAAVRFVSYEPALGPVDWAAYLPRTLGPAQMSSAALQAGATSERVGGIDWVICGGESGPNARPMHPHWARQVRDQCTAAGVPYLFKQWGEWAAGTAPPFLRIDHRGRDVTDLSGLWSQSDELMLRLGKKTAGRLLDGVEHNEFPEEATQR
jgi:protein gp37